MISLAIHTPTPEEDADWAELYAEAQAREKRVGSLLLSDRKLCVAWSPQPGSQVNFMRCPLSEALCHGSRGSGNPTGWFEFESVAQAKAWYNSEEYREPRGIRHNASHAKMIVVEGVV